MGEGVLILDKEHEILLKKAIAKSLYSKGYEQSRISRILGLTQPMVSNYLSSKNSVPAEIKKYAKEIAGNIGTGICFNSCVSFSGKSLNGKYLIAEREEILTDVKREVIQSLTNAFSMLKGKDISSIIPAVKINMAMAVDSAKNKDDIASFSNGLIILDNRISSLSSIRFGKSRHLSKLLIYLNSSGMGARAIMNIKYRKNIAGFSNSNLTNDYLLKEKGKFDILHHKGDFGIEPCSYVIGRDAKEVAEKVIKIIGE